MTCKYILNMSMQLIITLFKVKTACINHAMVRLVGHQTDKWREVEGGDIVFSTYKEVLLSRAIREAFKKH